MGDCSGVPRVSLVCGQLESCVSPAYGVGGGISACALGVSPSMMLRVRVCMLYIYKERLWAVKVV